MECRSEKEPVIYQTELDILYQTELDILYQTYVSRIHQKDFDLHWLFSDKYLISNTSSLN